MNKMSYGKNKYIYLLLVILILLMVILVNSLASKNNIVSNKESVTGEISFVSNRVDKANEIRILIEEFNEIYPDIKVKYELIGNVEEILKRKAAVGELYDVTLVPTGIMTMELKNYFLPIDDLNFTEEKIYNYNMGKGDDGKLYSLNTSVNWSGVIYNKELFRKANIEKVPESKEDFFEACEKLKNIGVTPVALNLKESWILDNWTDIYPYNLDSNLLEEIVDDNIEILDAESGVNKSLFFIREIVTNGYCESDLFNYQWEKCKTDMVEGKVAMVIWNSALVNQLIDLGINKADIGMFPIPESENIIVKGDYRFAISKKTKYPEAAKLFLKYLFEDNRYAKAVNIMFPIKNSVDTEEFFKNIKSYDLEIIIAEEYENKESDVNQYRKDVYNNTKKDFALDANFVRKFIMEENIDDLITDSNLIWANLLEEYKNKSLYLLE